MNVPAAPFLTRPQLAERWGMATKTLENWAVENHGPSPRRFGRRVMYRLQDIEAYETKVFEGDKRRKPARKSAKKDKGAA